MGGGPSRRKYGKGSSLSLTGSGVKTRYSEFNISHLSETKFTGGAYLVVYRSPVSGHRGCVDGGCVVCDPLSPKGIGPLAGEILQSLKAPIPKPDTRPYGPSGDGDCTTHRCPLNDISEHETTLS